jgi:acetolactate synthase small subunit
MAPLIRTFYFMSDLAAAVSAARFTVLADAYPGLLSRILEPFAKRDLTPDRVKAQREGDYLRTEIMLDAMPVDMLHLVAGNLGQIIGVLKVEAMEGRHIRLAVAA